MTRHRKRLIQELVKQKELFGQCSQPGKLPVSMPTHAQIRILFVLSHEGPQTLKDIADRFSMTPSAATQLVNGLTKERLVIRTEDLNDRRKLQVALTDAGKKKLIAVKDLRQKFMVHLLEPLTDQELEQYLSLQQKIFHPLKDVCQKNLT